MRAAWRMIDSLVGTCKVANVKLYLFNNLIILGPITVICAPLLPFLVVVIIFSELLSLWLEAGLRKKD